jgi:hypothetical protein
MAELGGLTWLGNFQFTCHLVFHLAVSIKAEEVDEHREWWKIDLASLRL